jgi:hypothetical protein
MKNKPNHIRFILDSPEHFEPETIRQILPEFTDSDIEQLHAIITIAKTDAAFEDFTVFEKIVRALNRHSINFQRREGVLVKWIWYAIAIIKHLRPNKEFSHEVKEYVKFQSSEECIYIYPPEMNIPESHVALDEVIATANDGPFPLPETTMGIQAGKYLTIQKYINDKAKKDKKYLERIF